MGERSEPRPVPLRLVLEFGESVELDGSTVYDPVAEAAVPAVVLRMSSASGGVVRSRAVRVHAGCAGW
jgi:hypothetical protein